MVSTIRQIVVFAVIVAALETRCALADDETAPKPKPQSEQAALALQIRQRVEELQALRREARQADEQHRGEVAVLQRQTETLHRQLPPVESSVRDQRRELTQLKETVARDTQTADRARQWISLSSELAAPLAQRAAVRAKRGTADDPMRRSTEFSEAATLLHSTEPTQQTKGLQQLARLIGDDWQTARSTSLANQRVEWDAGKRSQHVWVFRLGSISKSFVTEDAKIVGLGVGRPTDPWRLDLADPIQAQIRDAFAVAREQRPAAIVPFPVLRLTKPSETTE